MLHEKNDDFMKAFALSSILHTVDILTRIPCMRL